MPPRPRNCHSGPYALAFQGHLRTLMLTQGLSQTDFARRVGRRQSCVNNVLNGRNLPCLDDMDHWAAVLRLTDHGRDDFVLMAQLAHCPAQIQSFVRDLRRRMSEAQEATTRRIQAPT